MKHEVYLFFRVDEKREARRVIPAYLEFIRPHLKTWSSGGRVRAMLTPASGFTSAPRMV